MRYDPYDAALTAHVRRIDAEAAEDAALEAAAEEIQRDMTVNLAAVLKEFGMPEDEYHEEWTAEEFAKEYAPQRLEQERAYWEEVSLGI